MPNVLRNSNSGSGEGGTLAQEATQRSRRTAELLVEAATEEFLAHGYAASSVRRICERAGRTTGSLYRIFDGKEPLFTACVEPAVRALLVAFGSAPTPHGRMPEPLMPPEREVRLRAGLVAEAVMTHRAGVRLILRELDRPASRCVFARLTDAADQRLLQLLARLDPPVAPEGALAPQVTHWLALRWSYQLLAGLVAATEKGGASQLVPELMHATQMRLDTLVALGRTRP